MKGFFTDVIIDISHGNVDRIFEYRIPENLIQDIFVGVQVSVPFGKGNSLRRGYVVGLKATPDFDINKMKEIAGIVAEGVSVQSQLIQLAWWMRETYGSTMNQALKTVLPVKKRVKQKEKKTIICLLDENGLEAAKREADAKNYKARARLFSVLKAGGSISYEAAEKEFHISMATLKPLIEKKYIRIATKEQYRNPIRQAESIAKPIFLNEEQQSITEQFKEAYDGGLRKTYLLHGITGSGKTEVYMELIEHVLSTGKQAIVLIPEISLTYQTVTRFHKRFGGKVSIMNSRLSAGERYDQWVRAIKGEISVMIGPRSALFTPFEHLGLIIIDEEHDRAYKSETVPRYHAREAAEKRGALSGASIVLGSATPSLESYTKAMSKEYELWTLNSRAVKNSSLSTVETVDLRAELRAGNKTMFSRRLQELIHDRLKKREQIMLFINRRGYANFVSCRSCGEAVKCPHCDVSLTLHGTATLMCHYCGYTVPLMKHCPSCGSPYIANFGVGTQKLEEMTKKMFPGAKVLRMDADTTSKKNGHEEILSAFADQKADVLIGTQMIVKGHDYENVTLVGIMAADLSLNTPDFRCSEETFELLTQAAGRAGRGEKAGNVVIQTYDPEHYSIETAANQDYETFYKREMMYRTMMNYPPVCHMGTVFFASSDEKKLEVCAENCKKRTDEICNEEVQIIGPVKAPVYKVNDIYRKILYIKSKNCDILDQITRLVKEEAASRIEFREVTIQFDLL